MPTIWRHGLAATGLLAWTLASGWAVAGKAHEQGVARADIGVEVGRIRVNLALLTPDLVGFEREPRNGEVRALTPKGQMKRMLRRPSARVALAR